MARSIGFHDLGGVADDTPLQLQEHAYALWEFQVHALQLNLVKKGLLTVDELRRGIEGLPEEAHTSMTYYEKWASSMAAICIERGTLTQAELEQQLSGDEDTGAAGEDAVGPDGLPRVKFRAGDLVRVREENAAVRWRKPHLRTPGYIFGLVGTVERDCQGLFGNPEALAFRHNNAPKQPMYRVRFSQQDVWEGYSGPAQDTIDVEVYQPWLLPATQQELEQQQAARSERQHAVFAHLHAQQQDHSHSHSHDHAHSHSHDHSHDHDHDHHGGHHAQGHVHDHGDGSAPHVHDTRCTVEQAAADKEGGAQEAERRRFAEALIRAITLKGVVSAGELREYVEMLDAKGKQGGGAALVARAWVDPAFKKRLLADGNAAAAELGVSASIYPSSTAPPQSPAATAPASAGSAPTEAPSAGQGVPAPQPPVRSGTILTVVENTPQVHNIVVCTLCSCYPLSVLGMSPSWYKSRAYRARTVRNPRAVLQEFGTQLPDSVAVAVHDSTADNRYLVLPQRPAGTEGWSEEQLRRLVSRDSMIGVALATLPHKLAAS